MSGKRFTAGLRRRIFGTVVAVALLAPASISLGVAASAGGSTLLVPAQYPTIQAAVDAAADGDTVLVSPGVYGPVTINAKNVTLASEFHTGAGIGAILGTIIDGGGGLSALELRDTADSTRIIGFTIRNAEDGVVAYDGHFQFLQNIVRDTMDGIDYESSNHGTSGGLVRASLFEDNTDDGIDLDSAVEVVIEDSLIRNNGNDGIEIRLHAYDRPLIEVVMRRNEISGNAGDGIQFIGYPAPSNRKFVISRNLIIDNAQAGIGMMDNAETDEDYRGAPLTDRIRVANNTFAGNAWALTGGANTVFVNNAVLHSSIGALKNLTGDSLASHSGFWGNSLDFQNVNVGPDNVTTDPRMDAGYELLPGSPYIDAGATTCPVNGTVCDIGRFESVEPPPPTSTITTTTTSTTVPPTTTTTTTVPPTTTLPPPPTTTRPPLPVDEICPDVVEMTFTDVPTTSFAHDDIACLQALAIVTGTSSTTYSPHEPVTREQMAAFLARVYRWCCGDPSVSDHPFEDVSDTSYAARDISVIFYLGVTSGSSPTRYAPDDVVTRDQMAAFLARLYAVAFGTPESPVPAKTGPTPFTDIEGSFAQDDIGRIYTMGLTTGTGPTDYSPAAVVTREQMASFIARLMRVLGGLLDEL